MLSILLSIFCQGSCHAESTQLSFFSESEVLIDEPKVQHCVKSFHCEGILHCAKQNCSAQDIGATMLSTMPQSKNCSAQAIGCKHNAAKQNCSAQDIAARKTLVPAC
jgi:hypothetical protein